MARHRPRLKHHWEANYIVSGKGEVTELTSEDRWPLEAGILYVVGPNDRHRLHLTEDECHISIFCPPLTGDERFDNDGSYEASGPIEKTDRRMFVKRVDELRRAGKEMMIANGQVRVISMLTKADGIDFGVLDIRIAAGAELNLCHEDHWQANHVISGNGEVTNVGTDQTWKIEPSIAYNVGSKEQPRLRAHTDIHLLRMLSPPLLEDE